MKANGKAVSYDRERYERDNELLKIAKQFVSGDADQMVDALSRLLLARKNYAPKFIACEQCGEIVRVDGRTVRGDARFCKATCRAKWHREHKKARECKT